MSRIEIRITTTGYNDSGEPVEECSDTIRTTQAGLSDRRERDRIEGAGRYIIIEQLDKMN